MAPKSRSALSRLRLLSEQLLLAPAPSEASPSGEEVPAPWEASQPLAGGVCLVTGASRGVGKGCALAFMKAGATVYLTGRKREVVEATATELTQLIAARGGEGKAIGVECDAGDDAGMATLFERILSAHGGRLDILVNNVTMNPIHVGARTGTSGEGNTWWEKDSVFEWDLTTRVGLRSYFVAARLAAPAMAKRNSGLIVNISSFGGVRKYISIPHTIVKTSTDRLSADMADDLGQAGVACVSLYPGLVRTENMLKSPAGAKIAKSKASETPEFNGRAIVALWLAHKDLGPGDAVMAKGWSGKTVQSNEVGKEFGFLDVDGHEPTDKVMASVRGEMNGPPWYWVKPGMKDPSEGLRGARGLSKVSGQNGVK